MKSFKEFVDGYSGVPESVLYEDAKHEFSCFIKKMTSVEKDTWEVKQTKRLGVHRKGSKLSDDERLERYSYNVRARYLAEVVVDDKRQRVFTDEVAEKIGELPASLVTRVYEFAMKLNGFTDDDMEELEKN